jgi:hypothetical protein
MRSIRSVTSVHDASVNSIPLMSCNDLLLVFITTPKEPACNTISSTSLLPVCSDRSRHAAADRWIWQSSRFELNGKIGSHRWQDNSASGMLPVAEYRQGSMVANIDFPICT